MKIAITSSNNTIDSKFELRFGRAGYFCIYNTEDRTIKFIKNEYINADNDAGTKAAEKIIELGISMVISGDFGPKAKDLLNKFKVQMVMIDDNSKTIASIIKQITPD